MTNKISTQDIKQALKTLESFYLDYTNNYLTQAKIAEHYEIWDCNEIQKEDVILTGKLLHIGKYIFEEGAWHNNLHNR